MGYTLFDLPFDVLEVIGHYCDIDARRALGLLPKKIDGRVLSDMEKKLKYKHTSVYREGGDYDYSLSVYNISMKKIIFVLNRVTGLNFMISEGVPRLYIREDESRWIALKGRTKVTFFHGFTF